MSTILNKISSFLYANCFAFVAIVFITFINGEAYNLVGNFIWLPLGTVSLCYLLFGFRIVIAVFLAIMFSAHWFHEESLFILTKNIVHLVGTLAPLLAIASMKFFKLSNFFEGGKLVFQHLLFLVILTAKNKTAKQPKRSPSKYPCMNFTALIDKLSKYEKTKNFISVLYKAVRITKKSKC